MDVCPKTCKMSCWQGSNWHCCGSVYRLSTVAFMRLSRTNKCHTRKMRSNKKDKPKKYKGAVCHINRKMYSEICSFPCDPSSSVEQWAAAVQRRGTRSESLSVRLAEGTDWVLALEFMFWIVSVGKQNKETPPRKAWELNPEPSGNEATSCTRSCSTTVSTVRRGQPPRNTLERLLQNLQSLFVRGYFFPISRHMWTSSAGQEATPTLSKITPLLPGDTFSASSPCEVVVVCGRGSCASGADTRAPAPEDGRPRSLWVCRHAAETLIDSFTCSRSCCLALSLSLAGFSLYLKPRNLFTVGLALLYVSNLTAASFNSPVWKLHDKADTGF